MEDIAKACISIWGMPKFFDERRLVEELCRENNIRRIDREPYTPFPLKNIANLRVDFLKRAAEDRERKERELSEFAQPELLVRSEPYNDQPTETKIFDVKRNAQGRALVDPISTLKESFRNILINDFLTFKQNFPQHAGTTIIISETIRSLDEHADILLSKWKDGSLAVTYTKNIYKKMMEAKNSSTNIFYSSENSDIIKYFNNPTAENARKVFLTISTTQHMFGKAIDISGSLNKHTFKRDIVEFLNGTRRYTIFIYIDNKGKYTAENGGYRFYSKPEESLFNEQETQQMWATLEQDSNWFFHVQSL